MDSNLAKKIAASSPERLWFVARGSLLKGPFTTAQLKEKITHREVTFFDFCWRQGFNEWRPLGGVEDFDRRSKFRQLPQYPLVEVPAVNTGGLYLRDTAPPEEEKVERKVFARGAPVKKFEDPKKKNIPLTADTVKNDGAPFEVSFARHKRHAITHIEYAAAVIFAVIFAYFVSVYAMREVAKKVEQGLAIMLAGSPQKLGVMQEFQVPPGFWAPLYSAPGFDQIHPLPVAYSAGLGAPVTLPVFVEGHAVKSLSGAKVVVGNFEIFSEFKEDFWAADKEGIDPVYVRPIQVQGILNLLNPQEIILEHRGEPYLLPLSR